MDFQSIKNKYLIETDSKVFVGNVDEIKSLILTVEDQAETIEMYKKELQSSKEREMSYIDDLEQVEGMLKMANEEIKEMKKNSRLTRFYEMAEENLKLAEENARLKESQGNV